MAKLILKSSIKNQSFFVQQKEFKLPFEKEKVELIVTPKKLYSINPKDLSVKSLPAQVSKVKFSNSGNKVTATIFLKRKIKSSKNIILNIPIEGKTTSQLDAFNIFETTNNSKNVSVTGFSSNKKIITGNKTRYIVRNPLGKKSLILSKTFTIKAGFMFSNSPSCIISGNSKEYKVVEKVKKTNNKISSKTFDIYYTSSETINTSKDVSIIFTAYTQNPIVKSNIKIATKVSENKIYGIEKGVDPGPQGGIKRMTVKGVPGSTYSFLVSNSDGKMYNIKTGAFSDDGGLIEGIVPTPRKGRTYGESVVRIKIPRSASAQSISTQFIKHEDVSIIKAKIQKAVVGGIAGIIAPPKTQTQDVVSLTTPTLTFTISRNSAVLTSTTVYAAEAESTSTSSVTLTIDNGSGAASAATDTLFRGKKVYKSDGTLFGTCTYVNSSTELVFGDGLTGAIANNDVLYTYPDIYLGPKVKVVDRGETITSQDIFLGEESRETLQFKEPGQYKFNFIVSPGTDDKVVQITRQPLFVMPTYPEDNFVAWNSDATKKILAQQADGTKIPSDWDWSSVEETTKVDMALKCIGVGKTTSTDAISGIDHYAYSSVQVTGEIRVGNVGKSSASLDLKLDNFLSIITRS